MLHRRFVFQVWLFKSYPSNNPILLRFIPLFGYVRTRDLMLIMFSDKTRPYNMANLHLLRHRVSLNLSQRHFSSPA